MLQLTRFLPLAALAFGLAWPVAAAEDPKPTAAPQSCSANSADRTQSCNVTCPVGKVPSCVGGASDVTCACR